jgi:predicted DNA-binding transcriptional regulator YafY
VAPRVEPGAWQWAGRTINQREGLRLRYQRFDGATRDYLFEPYHLVAYHGNWYLLALNKAAGRIETILSWIPHVKVLVPGQLRDRVRQRLRQGLPRCG